MKKRHTLLFLILISLFSFAQTDEWTWMKGDNLGNLPGFYGTKGVSSPNNKPIGRYEAAEWKDQQGNFWLFGGNGPSFANYNDLWKYNPAINEWTWMSGDSIPNQAGVYGTPTFPSPSNKPGARGLAMLTWTDNNNNLWMFGGSGYDMVAQYGTLNDFWKYDISTNQWTTMNWNFVANQAGVYGTKGVSSSSNCPSPSTETACSWVDNNNNLWHFGGYAFDVNTNTNVFLNALWKYNISTNQWTWMSGDNISAGSQIGVYGTQGIPSPTNKPGGRWCYASWKDNFGNFWIFGGQVWDGTGGTSFNDMWKYDVATNEWTWMSGSNIPLQPNIYGTQCIDTTGAAPGSSVETRARWTDACGNFWLYGGGSTNSLFTYNASINKWEWVRGNSVSPIYGTMGVSAPSNTPATRTGAVGWISNDELWMFGGNGIDANNSFGYLNDLWRYVPDTACGGCDLTSLGTNENLNFEIVSVFPNPSSGQFTIESSGKVEITIYNMLGEEMLSQKSISGRAEIDLSREAKGIYFIRINSKKGMETRKIIIQ